MPYFKPHKAIKDYSYDPIYFVRNQKFYFRSVAVPVILTVSSLGVLLTQVLWPLMNFSTTKDFSEKNQKSVLALASGFRDFEFQELASTTNILGSTASLDEIKIREEEPQYFFLTIAKLGITEALVEIAPKTLNPDTALGHYPGSALPNQEGNVFIYGHSVLPWFYNPNNYKTIFSTIKKLNIGDEVSIKYKDKKYIYQVEGKRELKPAQVNPLASIKSYYSNQKSTLVLMTCTPEGTKLKRLLVEAVLIQTLTL